MAEFTVRVVLHDATWEDYTRLHQEMAARQLVDVIRADSGALYRLPDAEYYGSGNITCTACREIASEAAALTGRRYAVFVTEGGMRCWVGLERIQE